MPTVTNEILRIRQLFSHIAILFSSEVSVVFNISSSHVTANLSNGRFHMKSF